MCFELNLSSNSTLLSDSFGPANTNCCDMPAVLNTMLGTDSKLVLGTDDDGIWEIGIGCPGANHIGLAKVRNIAKQ